jgi:hypothetical protein
MLFNKICFVLYLKIYRSIASYKISILTDKNNFKPTMPYYISSLRDLLKLRATFISPNI